MITQKDSIQAQTGYWFRRFIHFSMALIPLAYYWVSGPLAYYRNAILCGLVITILLIELLRLSKGWVIYGQRDYERSQISAVAWGTFAIGIVLFSAPKIGWQGAAIGLPLIWSLAFADPIMGEMRRYNFSASATIITGALLIAVIWLFCSYWLGTPWWLALIATPITVLAELPQFYWIDDNALMLFLPLLVVLLLKPFYS